MFTYPTACKLLNLE